VTGGTPDLLVWIGLGQQCQLVLELVQQLEGAVARARRASGERPKSASGEPSSMRTSATSACIAPASGRNPAQRKRFAAKENGFRLVLATRPGTVGLGICPIRTSCRLTSGGEPP
jgi:hypothetical protein